MSRLSNAIHDHARRRRTGVQFRVGYVLTWLPRSVVRTLAMAVPITLFLGVTAWILGEPESAGAKVVFVAGWALTLGSFWALWPRPGRWVEIGPRGVRYLQRTDSSDDVIWTAATIDAAGIAGFELRENHPTLGDRVNRSIRPGTQLWVLTRMGGALPILRLRRPPRMSLRVSRRGLWFTDSWESVRGSDGSPLRWRDDTAAEVAGVLWAAFRDAVAERTPEHGPTIDLDSPLPPRVHPRPERAVPTLGPADLGASAALTPPQGRWEQYAVAFDGPWPIADRRDAVTVSAAGLRPSLASEGAIPAARVAGLAARAWTITDVGGRSTTAHLSLELTGGGWVLLPALQRGLHDIFSPTPVLWRSSDDPEWRPLVDELGRTVHWGPSTDARVADILRARIERVLTETTRAAISLGKAADAGGVTGGALTTTEGRHPQTSATSLPRAVDLQSAPIETAIPKPRDTGEPISRPRVLPDAPTALAAHAVPAWDDLAVPARYWTVAEERSARLLPRHPALRFTTAGVELPAWPRPRVIPYAECDTFAFKLSGLDVWQLSLVLRDGTAVALPGLSHGWFNGNALLWDDGAARVPMAAGRLPWADDDHSLVAARLNAQLALGLPSRTAAAAA